jgi:hypothetical protein
MCTILNTTTSQNLQHTSGEELLLLAVLGPANLKPQIDHELDRRALVCAASSRSIVPNPFTALTGHAA